MSGDAQVTSMPGARDRMGTGAARPRVQTHRLAEAVAFVTLLALFAAQALLASPQKSASFDEQYHLAAGYAYLRTGDFRLATNHPPLAGMVAALPLLARRDIVLPLDSPLWAEGNRYDFSDLFLWQSNADPQGILVQARTGILALGLVLLAVLFFWARGLLGVRAGWLVLVLATFDPNLIANARLVTTDLPLTCFLVLATWRLWAWLDRGRWRDLVLAGMFGGCVMAAKYNGLLFWPVALLIVLLYPPGGLAGTGRPASLGRRAVAWAAMSLIGVATLWAIYRFEFGPSALLPAGLPIPAPFYWDHLWATLTGHLDENAVKPDFLLGQVSTGGWWYYFPVALSVKTPLPLWIFFIAGMAALARRREWRPWRIQSVLWLPPLAILLFGLTGILTIGYRHMLPAIPFAILLAGNSVDWLDALRQRRIVFAAGGVLLVWLVVGTLRIFPHQESYFNEVAGDWRNWSNILVDSNLDWGQDLPALATMMDTLGIDTVNLAYFGKAVPELYGVRYRPLPGFLRFMEGREVAAYNPYTPEPGWYAVSATALRLGTLQPHTTDLFAYFRALEPIGRAGYSILLYKVEAAADQTVARPVVVDTPVYQLSAEQLGVTPGRRVQAKWLQAGGTTIFPQGQGFTPPDGDAFVAVQADLGGVLTLMGYTQEAETLQAGQPLSLTLYWRVGEQPMPQPSPVRGAPISVFVHVVDGDPAAIVAQFDGWETALRGLEPGDVIAQRVEIPFGEETAPGTYQMLAGVYSPQDGARLPATSAAGKDDHVVLGEIEVRDGVR